LFRLENIKPFTRLRLRNIEKEVDLWKDGHTSSRKSILESESTKECILEDEVFDDGDDNDDDDHEISEDVDWGEWGGQERYILEQEGPLQMDKPEKDMTLETEKYITDSTEHSIPWQADDRLDTQHNSRTSRNHTFN
jgi:hypothetical protein